MKLHRQLFLDALTHEDFFVRCKMLEFFSEDEDPDVEVTRRAIAAIERFGWKDAFEWPHQLRKLTLDESSTRWLLEQVERSGDGSPDERTKLHLVRWFCDGPVDLLQGHIDRLEKHPVVVREREIFRSRGGLTSTEPARFRMELAAKSGTECEAILDELVGKCARAKEFLHREIKQAGLLCERLKDAGTGLGLKIAQWLDFDEEQDLGLDHWRGGIAIRLAGLLRETGTAERLIEMFDYDWDWWNDEIQCALVAMGGRETLSTIVSQYPRQAWHGRLFLAGALVKLRDPGMEPAVAALLEDEEEADLRMELGNALVRYATPSAIEVARQVYDEDVDDPERFSIAEALYAYHRILGEEFPEMEEWRLMMEDSRRRTEAARSSDDWLASAPIAKPTPIAKPAPGVGRNDPCPCGSGKKYKKCCLPKMN